MIIILNGPPGCGKDTIANWLRDHAGYAKTCFKHALYEATAGHYGIPVTEVIERNENRDLKELPWHQGLSVRQMLIHVSENEIKPKHGKDYFGRKAAARLLGIDRSVVFADGGFIEELQPLKLMFGDRVKVVRLVRDGYDFTGDSRSYLPDPDLVVTVTPGNIELTARSVLEGLM